MSKKPDMTDTISKIIANINKNRGSKIAIDLTKEDLLQVDSWIEMPEWFTACAGWGKGVPCGHITQIVGKSDTGKTTVVMDMMIKCQEQGGVCFIIDSESKFPTKRFTKMGGDITRVIPLKSDTLEEAWDNFGEVVNQVELLRKSSPDMPIMVVWDSIAASVPNAMAEADAADHHVAIQAKINNKQVIKFRQQIRKYNIAAVLINHTYLTMPKFGIPVETPKGGEELYFQSTLILKTQRVGSITRERNGRKEIIGLTTKLRPFKSHVSDIKADVTIHMIGKGIVEGDEALKAAKKDLDAILELDEDIKTEGETNE